MSSFQDDPLRNMPLVTSPATKERRAGSWQIAITLIAATVIVAVFLWGINNQRSETGNEQTAATQPAPATPHAANPQGSPPAQAQNQSQKPETTGSSPNDQHKPRQAGAQNAPQQPAKPAQNQKPDTGGGSQPSQAAGKNN